MTKKEAQAVLLALPFLMKLRADGLVIDGARAAVGGDELIAERIDQALVAVDGHDVLPRREAPEIVRAST